MRADYVWRGGLEADVRFGFLGEDVDGPRVLGPKVVLNTDGTSVLRTLRQELARCERFFFSVAFVTPGAIAMLKQELVDFEGQGTIVTSDYLAFNSPAAYWELLNLTTIGVDVRIHPAKAFHPKGYIFESQSSVTTMMGSANLTKQALVENHEWNLKVSATRASDLGAQLEDLVTRQLSESSALTADWINDYAATYTPPPVRPARTVVPDAPDVGPDAVVPNRMQDAALASIAGVRAAGHDRAIVISATGTGKTILSALDVRAVDPVRLLFVVHREQILDKTISEYQRVLGGGPEDYGKLTGTSKQGDRRYVFATVQTLSQQQVLDGFEPDAFDYVIVDEAHRAGSPTHQRVIEHFTPEFMLGMTATPERTDGFNVFELFDYNVPYEIRLNHALEERMLSPFHYYGVSDLTYADGTTTTDETELQVLISAERVDHLLKALETYGQAGLAPRGLIFCSRRAEAHALSAALNERELRGRRLRTDVVTGAQSTSEKELVIRRLENGELDYVLSVDVLTEGVDIPTVNQVVMLRQTQSAIVFVQQLGRGLRLADGKEYLVVIDFIGNYANNFLIPIALFGNESLNKESLRQNLIAAEESGVLPGLSSVRFDRVAQERVLKSIKEASLDSLQSLKKSIDILRNRLGHLPALHDFLRFESVDPIVLATKLGNYPALVEKLFKEDTGLDESELAMLSLLSCWVFPARRAHELLLLQRLLEDVSVSVSEAERAFVDAGQLSSPRLAGSVIDSFTLENHHSISRKKYTTPVVVREKDQVTLTDEFVNSYLTNSAFSVAVDDLVSTGLAVADLRYDPARLITPGEPYTLQESLRLLGLPQKDYATVFGYKVYREAKVCPIFVTLHKDEDGAASTAYEDALLDHHTMRWFSKHSRTLASEDVKAILSGEIELHVFVKREVTDKAALFYLGTANASDPVETTMKNDAGKAIDVVTMLLRFEQPIAPALFDYFHPTVTE